MKKSKVVINRLVFCLTLFLYMCLPIPSFAENSQDAPILPEALQDLALSSPTQIPDLINSNVTIAESMMSGMSGVTKGTGTHFEIEDSKYINIVLESSENIEVHLQSAPEMVVIHFQPSTAVLSTQITIGGFKPLTTYYKYEDNYHNLTVINADENGNYTYTQDISDRHVVFIQPRKSTKFIKDNATGGDCTSIGTWDSSTRTCKLTIDVNETIQVDNDNITLDGNGRTLKGSLTGNGIYLYFRKNVTIKNLTVKNFYSGITLEASDNNTLSGNNTSNNSAYGINAYSSSDNNVISNNISSYNVTGILVGDTNNTVISNVASYNSIGIAVGGSNNILTNNNVQENNTLDLSMPAICNNTVQGTIGSGGKPIKFYNSAVTLENEVLSGLILCNADYSNIRNITIDASETRKNNGIIVYNTDYSNFTNLHSANNYYGILLHNSHNNALTTISVSSNSRQGIYLASSNNNQLSNSTISGNPYGMFVDRSWNNIISNTMFSSNEYTGIDLSGSQENQIRGNTITNTTAAVIGGGIRLFISDKNIIDDNTITNNYNGIYLYYSKGNILTYNTILNNSNIGIMLASVNKTEISDCIVQENGQYDVFIGIYHNDDKYCDNTLTNIVGSGGLPIKYLNAEAILENEAFSELILCNADSAVIRDVTIDGSASIKNNGILVERTDYATIVNTSSTNNYHGIYSVVSNHNTMGNNIFSQNNKSGIFLTDSNNTTVKDTIAAGNRENGIYLFRANGGMISGNELSENGTGINLWDASKNTLDNNIMKASKYAGVLIAGNENILKNNSILSNNNWGIYFTESGYGGTTNGNIVKNNTVYNHTMGVTIQFSNGRDNQIYNNNFIDNTQQVDFRIDNKNNYFNLDKPIGGNYWSDFDTPSEGCSDTNHDGFCDSPLYFRYGSGSADYLPWAKEDGWNLPSDNLPPMTTHIINGNMGNNNWFVSDAIIVLSVADDDSGVKEIYYSIDGIETMIAGSTTSITINTEGIHTISYYAVDNAGNEETPHHTVSIMIDKTQPTITAAIDPAPDANGWDKTDVTVAFACSDDVSGIASCSQPITITTDGGQIITGTAVDKAGNTASASVHLNVDKTPPVITASAISAPNANGWYNTDVTVTFNCTDATSGVASCTQSITVTAEGAAQIITGTAIDNAGNMATASMTVNIDKSAPNIANLSVNPVILWPPNHKMVDVLIGGSASDPGSGIESIVITVNDEYGAYNMTVPGFGSTIQLEAWREGTDKDGRHYTVTAVVTDKAGNKSTATTEVVVPHDMR